LESLYLAPSPVLHPPKPMVWSIASSAGPPQQQPPFNGPSNTGETRLVTQSPPRRHPPPAVLFPLRHHQRHWVHRLLRMFDTVSLFHRLPCFCIHRRPGPHGDRKQPRQWHKPGHCKCAQMRCYQRRTFGPKYQRVSLHLLAQLDLRRPKHFQGPELNRQRCSHAPFYFIFIFIFLNHCSFSFVTVSYGREYVYE
jgi:hypothetical protein